MKTLMSIIYSMTLKKRKVLSLLIRGTGPRQRIIKQIACGQQVEGLEGMLLQETICLMKI
jgi:hypothetical protein